MSIREKAEELFLDGYNCSEAMMLATIPDCSPDLLHAMGAFGGGMGCGNACGALCGGVGAIGAVMIQHSARQNPQARLYAGLFTQEFQKRFGATECSDLKPRYYKEGVRCVELVGQTAELLEQYLNEFNEYKNN